MRRILVATLALFLAATLVGCGALSKRAQRAQMQPPNGDGIYVASIVAADVVQTDWTTYAAIAYDRNNIPFGVPVVMVINRWHGAAGEHVDQTLVLNMDNQQVAQTGCKLFGASVDAYVDPELSQTCTAALDISQLIPGNYWLVATLDEREYARYQIRIFAPTNGSGGGLRQGQ